MFLFKIKSIYVFGLLCAMVFCGACNTVGSDGEDTFRLIDFESTYTPLLDKQFGFGALQCGPNKDCIAVAWEGNTNGTGNVFGFAARNAANTSSLIVYINKTSSSPMSGTYTIPAGQYSAIYRSNSNIYQDPSGSLTLTITRDGSKITITSMSTLNFTSPSTSLSASGTHVFQLY